VTPLISVIIPTYNRAANLRTCLEALANQSLDRQRFEVIVVVDGSTDDTRDLLATLAPPYELRCYFQSNSGQQVARNRGASEAQGNYCLFMDDDIIATPRLVELHLELHQRAPNIVGLGQISLRIPPNADPFTRCYAESWSAHFARLKQSNAVPNWQNCYGGNFSISEQQGMAFAYLPEAVGEQSDDKLVRELLADAESAGSAALTLCKRHPDMGPILLDPYLDVGLAEAVAHKLLLVVRPPTWLLMVLGKVLRRPADARRWYRFMHRHGYRRGISGSKELPHLNRGTPILMYHGFGDKSEPGSRYVVPINRFRWQMAWLKWRKFNVISLQTLVSFLRQGRHPPERSVVITIDDGYVDALLLSAPILQKYGFPATVFVVADRLGRPNVEAVGPLAQRMMLNETQIKKLANLSISIGAHSLTHARLKELSNAEKHNEIGGARARLEAIVDQPVEFFAYPYGEHDSACRSIAANVGYTASCGVDPGRTTIATPLHALRRMEIKGTDSLFDFMRRFR
jgi:glycosyltransferase involved in cell wall biosynthesis